jgi:hypothetical protein
LTNVAASALSFNSPTFTETPLCLTVGENEPLADKDFVSVYPNPATAEFRISNFKFRILNVDIYSALGERVFSQQPSAIGKEQEVNINAAEWNNGIYFVRIKTQEGMVVKKLIKQ